MRVWLAALCLMLAAVGLPEKATAQVRDPCETGERPKALCANSFDVKAEGFWFQLLSAADNRVRVAVGAQAIPSDAAWYHLESSDHGGPELVTFHQTVSDPEREDSPLIWTAWRFHIPVRDIAGLMDATYDPAADRPSAADIAALALKLPLTVDKADARTCPQIKTALDRLKPILRTELARPSGAQDGHMFDGGQMTVGVRGKLAGVSERTTVVVSGGYDTPTTVWAFETGKALADCWQPAQPLE